MKSRMTIKDFAELLGVSTATVSRAFSGRGRISEKTRQTIVAKAEEVGYRVNIHARTLGAGRSNMVALFYPAFEGDEPDYFIGEIMQGVSQTLNREGRTLQIHPVITKSSDIERCRDYILGGLYAGIIVVAGSQESKNLVKTAKSNEIPYVVIGHMSGEHLNAVTFDNERGAELAGRYFKATGRKFPAYVSGYLDKRKKNGFQKGLEELSEKLIITGSGGSFKHGALAYEQLKREHPEVDCVLCANDVLAMGLLRAATDDKRNIPEELAVIGFDDIRMASYYNPSVSSITLRLFQIGEASVQLLSRLLEGEEVSHPEQIKCDLILRESS
jgi:DNA-binding LacI/PurR family transcriptional regulator